MLFVVPPLLGVGGGTPPLHLERTHFGCFVVVQIL